MQRWGFSIRTPTVPPILLPAGTVLAPPNSLFQGQAPAQGTGSPGGAGGAGGGWVASSHILPA